MNHSLKDFLYESIPYLLCLFSDVFVSETSSVSHDVTFCLLNVNVVCLIVDFIDRTVVLNYEIMSLPFDNTKPVRKVKVGYHVARKSGG